MDNITNAHQKKKKNQSSLVAPNKRSWIFLSCFLGAFVVDSSTFFFFVLELSLSLFPTFLHDIFSFVFILLSIFFGFLLFFLLVLIINSTAMMKHYNIIFVIVVCERRKSLQSTTCSDGRSIFLFSFFFLYEIPGTTIPTSSSSACWWCSSTGPSTFYYSLGCLGDRMMRWFGCIKIRYLVVR